MTARFDIDHAEALEKLLVDPTRYHRYVIKANLKERLRATLREKHGILARFSITNKGLVPSRGTRARN